MIKRVLCSFCHRNCGMLVTVEDGQVKNVKPDKKDPISRGRACIRGLSVLDFHYHTDRLNYPLKRVGERGEGKWKRISWDQALDEIAEKLKEIKEKYGPEAVAIGKGTYRSPERWAMYRFAHLYGTPNIFQSGNICFCLSLVINIITYGAFALPHTPEVANTKCIVLWGKNPAHSYPHVWTDILKLKKRGTKLIVVDPRRTEAAAKADLWLQIRPQTDCALALGWINVIINESLFDKEFVKKWTNAPFLLNTETGKLLRETDLRDGGSRNKFVVWDSLSNDIVIWDPKTMKYHQEQVDPMLNVEYKIKLKNGKVATSTTVWQALLERVKELIKEIEKKTEAKK